MTGCLILGWIWPWGWNIPEEVLPSWQRPFRRNSCSWRLSGAVCGDASAQSGPRYLAKLHHIWMRAYGWGSLSPKLGRVCPEIFRSLSSHSICATFRCKYPVLCPELPETPVLPSSCTLSIEHFGPISFLPRSPEHTLRPVRTSSRDCHCRAQEVCLSAHMLRSISSTQAPTAVCKDGGDTCPDSTTVRQSPLGLLVNIARPCLEALAPFQAVPGWRCTSFSSPFYWFRFYFP